MAAVTDAERECWTELIGKHMQRWDATCPQDAKDKQMAEWEEMKSNPAIKEE